VIEDRLFVRQQPVVTAVQILCSGAAKLW